MGVWSLVKNNPYKAANAVGGAVQLGSQIGEIAGRRANIGTPDLAQNDANGMPEYNFGKFASETQQLDPTGASAGDVLSAAGTGATTGAAIGSVVPGIGTAVGAVAGGVVGAVGSFVGGLFGKASQEEEQRKANGLLRSSQNNYNQGQKNYNQNYLARQKYEDQLRSYNMPTSYV